MTHKLSTILLPTGRWLALMSTSTLPGAEDTQSIANAFIDAGAAGFLVTDMGGFEVDNALVDERAVDSFDVTIPRAEARAQAEKQEALQKRTRDFVKSLARYAESQHYTDFLDVQDGRAYAKGFAPGGQVDPMTYATFEKVLEGAELTPAGLIKLTDEQKAEQSGLTEEELTGMTAMAPLAPEELAPGTRVFILADESVAGTNLTTENYGTIRDDIEPLLPGGDYWVATDSGLIVCLAAEDVRPLDGVDPVSVAAGNVEAEVGEELLDSISEEDYFEGQEED